MLTLSYLILLGLLSLHAIAKPCKSGPATGRAIYTITNEKVNRVLGLPILSNGSIGEAAPGHSIATGGSGSNGLLANKELSGPDALFSQSALTITGSYLFAVNAGSNTVSMFAIDQRDPTQLTMIGQPALVPGDFPTTVTASERLGRVCVGCSGAEAGISCASFTAEGLGAMDPLRSFDLGQTTPPVGPTNTVSQVFFSDADDILFSTVKGDPSVNKTGFLAAFPISGNNVSHEGVYSSPNGTAVLFGSSTIPGSSNSIFVVDASFGAVVLHIDKLDRADIQGKGIIDGQKATCWSTISPATNTSFVADAARDRLVEMSTSDASIISVIDLSANGDPGLTDLQGAGRFIYALSPGNGTTQASITVVDAISKQQVQHIQLEAAGLTKNAQGVAIYV